METIIRIIADGLMIPLALIAIYMLIFKIPAAVKFDAYKRILQAGLISYSFAKILAQIYQPETLRPFQKLGVDPGAAYLDNPGFPSDHALFAVFLVLVVWMTTKNKPVIFLLASLALAVCIGRVLALVHTPLDVIGGILVAFIGLIAFYGYTTKSSKKHSIAKKSKKHS